MSSYSLLTFSAPDLPKEYISAVYSHWRKSLRHGNPTYKLIDPECYFNFYSKLIEHVLTREDCRIRVAVLSDDVDVLLGFSVCRGPVLDYVYVQKDQRKHGIGTSLFPYGTTHFTHVTKTAELIWKTEKYKHLKFNPFA